MSCQSSCLTFKYILKAPSQGSTGPRTFFSQCQMQSACMSILILGPLSKVLSPHAKAKCCIQTKLQQTSTRSLAAFPFTECEIFGVSLFLLTVWPPTSCSSKAASVSNLRHKVFLSQCKNTKAPLYNLLIIYSLCWESVSSPGHAARRHYP